MSRIRVAVLFGGRSAEHEISLLSARNIVGAMDQEKYEPVLVGIDRQGRWFITELSGGAISVVGDEADSIRLDNAVREVALLSTGPSSELRERDGSSLGSVDVVFPVLHGPFGEDGTVQGLAKLADLPCVGAGVLGSAVGMDKDVMKRLLRDAGLPIAPFETVRAHRWAANRDAVVEATAAALGPDLYVKPVNLGSSVGISHVEQPADLAAAIDDAFRYDTKVIVEAAVKGREIECSVLGNDQAIASVPGEIIASGGFYSYSAKYLDENGAVLKIPADLSEADTRAVQDNSLRAFEVLCCSGMARVDGFLTSPGRFVVNEINTIPGFTRISMYPKLFEASGISQAELIDRLITLAIERHNSERDLSLRPPMGD